MGYAAMVSHAVGANAVEELFRLKEVLVCCHYHVGIDRHVHSLYYFFREGASEGRVRVGVRVALGSYRLC